MDGNRSHPWPPAPFTPSPDFPCQHIHHLVVDHDGYPTGAAWRLAAALRETPEPVAFLAAFLRSQPGARPIATPEEAVDADYRYGVELLPGLEAPLLVQCWRRLPGSSAWHSRCGPMALTTFIRRFLPGGSGDGAPFSALAPGFQFPHLPADSD